RYPQATPLAEVQAALRPGEALLAFFLGADSSHRWLVWPGSLEYRLLPGRREVEGAVRSAYAAFAHPQGTAEEPARLSALLLAGLDPSRLPRRLLLVPDGAMFYLPFEALPLADGRLMGDLVATSYLPAAALALGAGRGAAPAPRLLALGGAEYGGGSGDGTSRAAALEQLRHLPPLPHSEREARRVAALWGEDDATVLTGAAASEAQLRAMALGDYSVLHLASHGWLDPVSSARSGLVLAPGDAAHDGLLQVREILELPLAAELVTLSACGSALGELVTGEGMVGVTRAFLHAGADAVVASLWNVDDESAAAFMAAFYGALRQGVPRGEALQRARAALRADARWRHPYHWAAWVLVGRGDTGVAFPPRRGLPAWAWAVAAALAAIALGGAAWARGRRRREASPGPPST
ncbi:MAG TPA: CHAT domain-containing protein, partial [Thermoanaerobaculia bacterium]|nr:CHAT domain-containing protein [Thermoanaerobaculia bacterium]